MIESILHVGYIVLASIFVLFIPGFFLSLVSFEWKKIDLIERLALSFALSIAVVPLLVFYANLAGFRMTTALVIIVIEIVSVLGLAVHMFRPWFRKKFKKGSDE